MKLLVLHNSLNAVSSASRELTDAYVSSVIAQRPDAQVITRDLAFDPVPHLPAELVSVQYGRPAPEQTQAVVLAETLIIELEAADILVIGMPMYNFTIPSTLKSWLDHIIRAGRTFAYVDGAPKGLLPTGKQAVVLISSSGVYTQGPAKEMDFIEPYLRAILGFVGITDVKFVRAEAQAVAGLAASARAEAVRIARDLALEPD
jgi:FMN-dependent NADH-azoreductase